MKHGQPRLIGSTAPYRRPSCGHVSDLSNYCSLNQWYVGVMYQEHTQDVTQANRCLKQQCLCLCTLSAILLGVLYLFFGAFPLVFKNNHGFTLSQSGLSFLGILVGMIVGVLTDPLWARNYRRLLRQYEARTGQKGACEPEFRLPPTILGSFLVPISLFGEQRRTLGSEAIYMMANADTDIWLVGFGWTIFPWVSSKEKVSRCG
jgi:hypothetical protein